MGETVLSISPLATDGLVNTINTFHLSPSSGTRVKKKKNKVFVVKSNYRRVHLSLFRLMLVAKKSNSHRPLAKSHRPPAKSHWPTTFSSVYEQVGSVCLWA